MKEKLKSWLMNDQLFYGFLVFLVAICSFILGRISVENSVAKAEKLQIIEPITLQANNSQEANIITTKTEKTQKTLNTDNQIVASKNGTRYYLASCSGAKRIKPENIITFKDRESAESAGYTKAVNCPGL